MPNYAPAVAEEERQEPPDALDRKADVLADLISSSQHLIAFTGAGISTSAGIPDFRGPDGSWTLMAQGRQRMSKTTSTLQAIPTPTHMALVALQERGLLKYLVSQNCDGLHRRSGIFPDKISELHGNSNREYCKDCGKEYIRDFRAVAPYEKTVFDHRTGRKCAKCDGDLHDTIINFGESLPAQPLQLARDNAKKADLCLVLGSSLTVSPANEIPEAVGRRRGSRASKGPKLAICNLQTTPIDDLSDEGLRVFSRTDELMVRVMERLEIPIPVFILRRRLVVELQRFQSKVYGVDVDGTPVSFLQSVKMEGSRRAVRTEPFVLNHRDGVEGGSKVVFELEFMGHYGEPNLRVEHEYDGEEGGRTLYRLEYNPASGEWRVERGNVGGEAGDDGNVSRASSAAVRDESTRRVVIDLTDEGDSTLGFPE